MITKEEFIGFINSYREFDSAIERIEEALCGKKYGVCLFECDWYNHIGKMLDIFIDSNFTSAGSDLIYWWMFEDVDHIITQKVDPDLFNGRSEAEYDVNDIEDLWKYMITYKSDYFKDA